MRDNSADQETIHVRMPGELIERMRNAGQREGYVNLSEIARHAIREWVTSVEASRKLAATS